MQLCSICHFQATVSRLILTLAAFVASMLGHTSYVYKFFYSLSHSLSTSIFQIIFFLHPPTPATFHCMFFFTLIKHFKQVHHLSLLSIIPNFYNILAKHHSCGQHVQAISKPFYLNCHFIHTGHTAQTPQTLHFLSSDFLSLFFNPKLSDSYATISTANLPYSFLNILNLQC